MTTFSRALIEVTIAAPADEVWQSLRTAPALEVELSRNGEARRLRWPIEP